MDWIHLLSVRKQTLNPYANTLSPYLVFLLAGPGVGVVIDGPEGLEEADVLRQVWKDPELESSGWQGEQNSKQDVLEDCQADDTNLEKQQVVKG